MQPIGYFIRIHSINNIWPWGTNAYRNIGVNSWHIYGIIRWCTCGCAYIFFLYYYHLITFSMQYLRIWHTIGTIGEKFQNEKSITLNSNNPFKCDIIPISNYLNWCCINRDVCCLLKILHSKAKYVLAAQHM